VGRIKQQKGRSQRRGAAEGEVAAVGSSGRGGRDSGERRGFPYFAHKQHATEVDGEGVRAGQGRGNTLLWRECDVSGDGRRCVGGGGRSSEWSCVLPVLIEELLGTSSSDITMLGEESVGST
jgi:hypothetical protein